MIYVWPITVGAMRRHFALIAPPTALVSNAYARKVSQGMGTLATNSVEAPIPSIIKVSTHSRHFELGLNSLILYILVIKEFVR